MHGGKQRDVDIRGGAYKGIWGYRMMWGRIGPELYPWCQLRITAEIYYPVSPCFVKTRLLTSSL